MCTFVVNPCTLLAATVTATCNHVHVYMILFMSRYRHPNLVELMGICRSEVTALVYEYMTRGSLYHNLHNIVSIVVNLLYHSCTY